MLKYQTTDVSNKQEFSGQSLSREMNVHSISVTIKAFWWRAFILKHLYLQNISWRLKQKPCYYLLDKIGIYNCLNKTNAENPITLILISKRKKKGLKTKIQPKSKYTKSFDPTSCSFRCCANQSP